MPAALVLGEEGPAVLLSGRVARHLAPVLLAAVRRELSAGNTVPDDVADAVAAIDRAGRGWAAYSAARVSAPTSDNGRSELPIPPPAAMVRAMDTRETAEMIGCTQRNVVDLIARRSIPAHRSGGRWLVEAADVAEYLEARA